MNTTTTIRATIRTVLTAKSPYIINHDDTALLIISFLKLDEMLRTCTVHTSFRRNVYISIQTRGRHELLNNSCYFISNNNFIPALIFITKYIHDCTSETYFSVRFGSNEGLISVQITKENIINVLPIMDAQMISSEEWISMCSIIELPQHCKTKGWYRT